MEWLAWYDPNGQTVVVPHFTDWLRQIVAPTNQRWMEQKLKSQ